MSAIYFFSLVTFEQRLLDNTINVMILSIPFFLMVWGLCTESISKFIMATILYIVTYIFIGLPLSAWFFSIAFDARFQNPITTCGGEHWERFTAGLALMVALVNYVIMSIIAWVVALILSLSLEWYAYDRK